MGTTFPTEVIERVTGYIKHNAAKSPEELRAIVQQGHDQLAAQLDGMSDEQAQWKPAATDWSVLELMHHVVSAKRGVARICQRLARGEQVPGVGREGDEQDGMTRGEPFPALAAARAAMDAAHAEQLAFIDGQMAAGNTEVRFPHFLFGELNCREWAAFQRAHDFDHTSQIEKIRSAPGFPAS